MFDVIVAIRLHFVAERGLRGGRRNREAGGCILQLRHLKCSITCNYMVCVYLTDAMNPSCAKLNLMIGNHIPLKI